MVTGGFISPNVFQQRLKSRGIIVALRTVQNWCKRREVDARMVGRAWRIREREVDRIAEGGTGSL
jgi:hypothetical protein